MYDKILVPFDGSKHALRALNIAIQIAKNFSGKITLINVCEIQEALTIAPPGEVSRTAGAPDGGVVAAFTLSQTTYTDVVNCMREYRRTILEEGEKTVKAERVPVDTMGKEGNVVEEILNAARVSKFDLIVMGSRGLSKIKELALGSVSDGVLRNSPCPVLMVK